MFPSKISPTKSDSDIQEVCAKSLLKYLMDSSTIICPKLVS